MGPGRGHRDGPKLTTGARQGVRRNAVIRAYYERIQAGKRERRKIALVAMAHWLLRRMFAMLRTGEARREAA